MVVYNFAVTNGQVLFLLISEGFVFVTFFFLSECNFLWFVFTDCTISEMNLIVLLLYTLETLPYRACKSQNPHTVLTGSLRIDRKFRQAKMCEIAEGFSQDIK